MSGGVQVFQQPGAGVPGAVEELALGAGMDLEGDAAARAGGGGGGYGGDRDDYDSRY